MKIKKENIKSIDIKLSIALMASFVVLTFQYLLLIIFNLMGTSFESLVQTISKIVVAIFFVYAFPAMWKRSGKIFVIIYGITILIFSLHFIFYIPNRPFLVNLIFPIFFISLPALTYMLAIRDLKEFQVVTKKAANLVFIFGIIISIFIFSGNSTMGSYSMSLSYYMLLPALIFIGDFLDKYRFSSFFFSLFALVIILSLGSRGALLCISIFILLKLIRFNFKPTRKALIFRFGVLASIILLVLNFQKILLWLNILFEKYGISSRTIKLLQEGEVHLSGRDNIVETVIEGLKNNPITGIGIAGDRVFAGTYSHNFFVEIMSSFGIILGLIILGLLLIMIIRSIIISSNFNYELIILWLSLGFVNLMVSGSYLIEMKFWILFGLLISLNFKSNNRKSVEYE